MAMGREEQLLRPVLLFLRVLVCFLNFDQPF